MELAFSKIYLFSLQRKEPIFLAEDDWENYPTELTELKYEKGK